jgi:hypothetical protein
MIDLESGMRDMRFVAEHRGGSLKKEQHWQLMQWACQCAEKALLLQEINPDFRLLNAIRVAKDWERGIASVGQARKASVDAINTARELSDPVAIAVARSVGHAVATAHMADHSLGAAIYGLKAVYFSGKSVEAERKWQNGQLPEEIFNLVITARAAKESHLKFISKEV